MRTMAEMNELAIRIRRRMIDEGKSPYDGEFQCSHEELTLMKDQPMPFVTLSEARDRICGLKIVSY